MTPVRRSTISRHVSSVERRSPRGSLARAGQATAEFAIVSVLFLMIVLGTFDIGRAVYMDSQLTNAVREGARYAQVSPTDTTGIQNRVIGQGSGLGLKAANITTSCSPSTCATGSNITVKASLKFTFIAQSILGLSPLTMHAQATDAID